MYIISSVQRYYNVQGIRNNNFFVGYFQFIIPFLTNIEHLHDKLLTFIIEMTDQYLKLVTVTLLLCGQLSDLLNL